MKLNIIDSSIDSRWFDFISHHPKANIFHHPNWHSVLKKQYNFNTFVIAALNEEDKIIAGIPFSEVKSLTGKTNWISLPFSDYCNILYKDEKDVIIIEEFLVNKLETGKISSIEIRGEVPGSSRFLKRNDFFLHTTMLQGDCEKLFSTFKKTQIQQPIKKAERDGVSYKVSTSSKQMEEFYSLHLKTRKKLGVPIQPKSFFNKVYDEIIKKDLGFIVITYMDSFPIGAGVFFGFENILTYKYSASDPEKLKLRPNHLMLWGAFQEGIKRGFKYFDFGKTEIQNEGLRKFKAGWGSIEEPLYYSYYPQCPGDSKLKVIQEKFIGPMIKNSPEFVCRTIGEIAYKYFPSI
jgi:lipid II:glycine glycyltransferase (peptidoglycan interpeptide bridge formation enzyme)